MHLPKFWYLQNLHIDERLPGEAYDAVAEHARLERWGHMADIFRAQDDSDVSVILEGNVWLQDVHSADEVALERGDLFGKANGPLEHQDLVLRAHDDTLLAVVSRAQFRELIAPHLGRLETRVGMFYQRREIWVPLGPLLFTTPRCRIAKALLHVVESEGALEETGGARLDLRMPPRKLADLTGVDPHRVKRVLDALEVDKILELGRGETRIWDLDALRRIAQGG